MAANKKLVSTIAAVATSAALLLGGTLAWQSANQTALNEASDVVNPGGRLHDDFYIDDNGDYNADIYVENFAEEDIFARVKLQEYMEVVLNYKTAGEKLVNIVGSKSLDGAEVTDKPTDNTSGYEYEYITHDSYALNEDYEEIAGVDQKHPSDNYWTWTMGSPDSDQVYYMPTFNMNKDSLVADRNGMYVDRIGGISNRGQEQYYTDDRTGLSWTVWTENATKDGTEIWDVDYNTTDEVGYMIHEDLSGFEGKNIQLVENTHTAQLVGTTNGFISMTDWLKKLSDGENTADYWVYDEDNSGWIYWSSPIKGDTATGLLLDSIELNDVMDDTWYYAINAIGQFVTADDVGKTDGTGFYDASAGEAPSADAEDLLRAIGVFSVDEEAGGDDDPYYEGAITVDGQGPDDDGYIYLYGLDIEKNNSFTVNVSEDFELAENGLTAEFHEDEIDGTKMEVSDTDPYTATLTIAARDYHSVTITATDVSGEIETVTVVPVYSTIVITPDMDDQTLTIPSGYYSLRAEKFNPDNVAFTLTGAKRSNIVEDNGEQKLNISSYESSTDITLTASNGTQTANVKIVVAQNFPYDGPIYTYYIQGAGSTWAYALMETQNYAWEQNDDYTYQVRAGMTNDYAGTMKWRIIGNTTAGSAYFANDEGTNAVEYIGTSPDIKFTADQTRKFTILVDIYEDQEMDNILTDEYGDPYSADFQYFTIYPTQNGKPVVYHLSVRSDEYGTIYLAPGDKTEVYFMADIREDGVSISNADVTWSLVEAEEGCTFTIAEGDESDATAIVTHACPDDECTKIGAVQAKVSYDHAYGQEAVSEFYIVAEGYEGDIEIGGGEDDPGYYDDPELAIDGMSGEDLPMAIPANEPVELGTYYYDGDVTYYVINKEGNADLTPDESGYYTTSLQEKVGYTTISLSGSYMGQPMTQHFYGEAIKPDENGYVNYTPKFSVGTPANSTESIMFVAMDDEDNIIAKASTRIYDPDTHTYAGSNTNFVGNAWYLVFEAKDGDNTVGYCVSNASTTPLSVDPMYPASVTEGEDEHSYYVGTVSGTACTGNHGSNVENANLYSDEDVLTEVFKGQTYNLSVKEGDEVKTVTSWKVVGNRSSGTSFSGDTLNIGYFEDAETLTILATIEDETFANAFTVDVSGGNSLTELTGYALADLDENGFLNALSDKLFPGAIISDVYVVSSEHLSGNTTPNNADLLGNTYTLSTLEVVGSDPGILDITGGFVDEDDESNNVSFGINEDDIIAFRTEDWTDEPHSLYVIAYDNSTNGVFVKYTFATNMESA